MDALWSDYIWPLAIIVADSVLLIALLLIAVAYLLYADRKIWAAVQIRRGPNVILGKGEYRYRVVENWGELPPVYTYGDTAAVCVDSNDNVYVFTRGAHPTQRRLFQDSDHLRAS